MPAYDFDAFVQACRTPGAVHVSRDAEVAGGTVFKLRNRLKVLAFIANGGLEEPHFINTKPWENDPDPDPDPEKRVKIDAYGFFSGPLHGYIAFSFQPKRNQWVIKSFHRYTEKP